MGDKKEQERRRLTPQDIKDYEHIDMNPPLLERFFTELLFMLLAAVGAFLGSAAAIILLRAWL